MRRAWSDALRGCPLLIVWLLLCSVSGALAQPRWAAQPPPGSSLYLYGVGIAHDTKDPAKDRQRADDAARADIVRQIRVTVSARLTSITTETSDRGVSYDTQQIVESSVSFTLEGLEIKERYYDKKHRTYYALARLNRQAAAERVASAVRSAAQRAAGFMKQAERYRAEGATYRAFLALFQAAEERAGVEPDERIYRALASDAADAALEGEGLPASPFTPAMAEIDKEINTLVTGLSFERLSGDRQTAHRGRLPLPVSARLTVRTPGSTVPAAGFPMAFRITQGRGKLDPYGTTGPDGEAASAVYRIVPCGEPYSEITAALDTAAVRAQTPGRQADRWMARLGDVRTRFTLLPGEYGLEDGIAELAGRLTRNLPEGLSMVVDRFTYRDTHVAGPFTGPLRQHLASELAAAGRGRLIEAPALTADAAAYGNPGEMETLARTVRADAVVWGTYTETGDSVLIQARMTGQDGVRLAAAEIVLPRAAVPHAVRPPALDVDLPAPPAHGLPVHLWTDRGDGALYVEGERLNVYVQAETDCYLRLLYRQADGQTVQIFPNRLAGDERVVAGQVYTIPDVEAPYMFVVQPPFGVEYLVALASATPFSSLTGRDVNGGVALNGSVREVIQRLTRGKTRYGQAVYRMTTVGR